GLLSSGARPVEHPPIRCQGIKYLSDFSKTSEGSPVQILQQQLDSFQALRQQTLQNVSMVQSEINHILNKNITDMKSPEFIPDNLLLTSSPINTTMVCGVVLLCFLHIKENIAQAAYDRKRQMNFLSKYRPTKIDQPRQQLSTNQELRKHQEFCGAVSDEYAKKVRWLETSDRESQHVCNKVMSHEDENESKPLTDVIQSLTEQNSKYQKQIKDLHDEKNSLQERLVKSEEDCKECLKEVKRLLKKCKEFQQQKSALEEKQEQLYSENQRMMSEINDLQQKDQKTQETLAFSTHEKISTLQEENKKLGGEVLQLTDNKGLLEKVVGENQNEMQQLKINEKTTLSNLEALIRMTQSLKDEKQSLEKALQEVLTVKEVLQKGLEEAQSGRTNTEEKLLMERKSTKIEIGVLKTNLSNMERECERMRMVVADMTDENHVLKKELNAYKQEASDCRNKTRLLSEQLLLMENEIRSTENERDVLQFEARRLQKNNASLRDQTLGHVQASHFLKSITDLSMRSGHSWTCGGEISYTQSIDIFSHNQY
uniref:Uncharacterized protein n=1 Tax=Podarcis muralis TaxID=64176 RepID=A0A670IPW2_PODMU